MDQQTQLKKKFDKGQFSPSAGRLKIAIWYLCNLVCFNSGLLPFSNVLVAMLRLFGAKIGRDVRIKPGIYIKYPWKLKIGDHSWLADCRIENLDHVTIGCHVCISSQVLILTGNHNYKSRTFDLMTSPVQVDNGAWIAARAIVCPGVKMGSHAILTTASVANGDLLPYIIYKGNPARPIRKRSIA